MGATHTIRSFNDVLVFATRHERKLGAGLFALGFLTDLLTFGLLPASTINWFFIAYLTLAVVTTLGTHSIFTFKTRDVWWKKTIAVLFPLVAQYAFGGLFSGFVVFYARSSVFSVSWPFLLLLLIVYAGNEYFRKQREHLIFQTVLLFIALYAYTIFALPLYVHMIGPWVFVGSTVAAIVLFALFVWALHLINADRLKESFKMIASSCGAIIIVMCGSYFSGLIPPLPLALADAGVYHQVTHVPGGYEVKKEEQAPWWHIQTQTLQVPSGGSLSAFTAVKAPIAFSSTVVHRWEHYNEKTNDWTTQSVISFGMSGGREEGYRGYSTKGSLMEGKWRVSVETPNGQTIGRLRFDVEFVDSAPTLYSEIR